MPTVCLSANIAWNIVNFRSGLVRGLRERGYRVVVLAAADETVPSILELGAEFQNINLNPRSTNPLRDLALFLDFRRAIRAAQAGGEVVAFLGFTVKPNVYGSIAARSCGVPAINNVAGLGRLFSRPGLLQSVAVALYRIGLRRSRCVFFQNADDRELFLFRGVVRSEQCALLPGSGIDLRRFSSANGRLPSPPRARRFLLVARLLWDKGIGEYAEAAAKLRKRYPECEFRLAGFADGKGRSGVPEEVIDRWVAEGSIAFLGRIDDIRPAIDDVDCLVLPTSYREGTPRVLLESAAMSRPIVSTDTPGARDVCIDSVTGFLCRPRDAESLTEALERVILLPCETLSEMGRAARLHVEARYDEHVVIDAYARELARLG